MATLVHVGTGRQHRWTSRLLVGRSPACGLRLNSLPVSGEHATILWTGEGWEIRDLGSKNGTLVDDRRVQPGRPVRIDLGSRISFGDASELWELQDASPPSLGAVRVAGGARLEARDGLLVLPSTARPEVTLYQDAAGAWLLETGEGDTHPAADGEQIAAGGELFRLEVPEVSPLEGTPLVEGAGLDALHLRFGVSANEERVELTAIMPGREVRLDAREHFYVLLVLARIREGHKKLAPADRGWVDRAQLERMLRMDSNSLNVAIHRARQQLAEAGIPGSASIVEVKRGKRRLSTDRFEVVRL